MTAYVLTTEAEADLRGIIRYTRKEWGAAQVRRYIAKLEHGIAALADGHLPFKDMSEIYPALRMARCEHHYVFCLPREDAAALIVAILHERMDLLTRLSARLNQED
ncbi:plasmid stabilization system protein ParE|uniref:Plasmid stabilization system protein ParE n=1 Tax=Brenneria salicis ATCC 15712 = DSM 30166 TaxID=714314 RepID=A0A366HWH6_9GAMM|nr:type II toxin-antitoxin system RelE/ParE family toxin [Brenneria salicis]NMN90919.1 plasmid stabilization system protein ParE [Brenneria salicis ATCC 15712 = DSM 30166]RBP57629.1 plasmid stabilization system protein ParE [Brenneria salicis ATCC 15712 = DSM 30166]RLM28702.1 plasmid stabilization protein ParE [Brenneria salicis ATCC 15712 = DSM 30166]